MTGRSKAKGDRAEREISRLLEEELGYRARRKLGAGRQDDEGDLDGLPNCTAQVVNWARESAAVRDKPLEAETQRVNAGTDFAVTLVKLHGGQFRAVMTIKQFCDLLREATS